MNCEAFEILMADALGNELVDSDRAGFDSHLAACETCRREWESLRRTVDATRALAGPKKVSVRRDGERLVIQPDASETLSVSHGSQPMAARNGGLLRMAASVLIAFTAGYALHAGLMMADNAKSAQQVAQLEDASPQSVRTSLALAHVRNPSRSSFAKCLATITRARR